MLIAAEGTEAKQARLAVIGSPISHSRSPRIHAAAYQRLGLDWAYEALECEETALQALLDGRGESWRGFSVTMPLKEEAYRLCTVRDAAAEESGVVNTLLRVAGGGSTGVWAGFNTDVAGLARALEGVGLNIARPLVVGSGATAVSAVMALQTLGAEVITLSARRVGVVQELAERFNTDAVPVRTVVLAEAQPASFTSVIATLPGPAGREVLLPEQLTAVPLFDVAYDPWPSPLAERWRAAGGVAHSGLTMLVEQALLQVRIFVNGDPTVALPDEEALLETMRRAADGAGVGG